MTCLVAALASCSSGSTSEWRSSPSGTASATTSATASARPPNNGASASSASSAASAAPGPAASNSAIEASASAAPIEASATLEVVARLVDTGSAAPYCGIVHVIKTMKYEVVRVVHGKYSAPYLFVAHGCPELSRARYKADSGNLTAFKEGELHKLKLHISTQKELDATLNHKDRGAAPLYQSDRVDLEP
ncbi:MAG: hypothetical protein U0271_14205 [Polyangiaceae bacterium]